MAFLAGGLVFTGLASVYKTTLGVSDFINSMVAIGAFLAVAVALYVPWSAERKSHEKNRRVAALTALRLKPSIFTLLSQVSSVRNVMSSQGLEFFPELNLHRHFLELSSYTTDIGNSALEAISLIDEEAAITLAQGLGEVESLTKKVGLLQASDKWRSADVDARTGYLNNFSEALLQAHHKIERATILSLSLEAVFAKPKT